MAQNSMDLLTGDLQLLKDDLRAGDGETLEQLIKKLQNGARHVEALVNSAHHRPGPFCDSSKGACVVNFYVAWHNASWEQHQ